MSIGLDCPICRHVASSWQTHGICALLDKKDTSPWTNRSCSKKKQRQQTLTKSFLLLTLSKRKHVVAARIFGMSKKGSKMLNLWLITDWVLMAPHLQCGISSGCNDLVNTSANVFFIPLTETCSRTNDENAVKFLEITLQLPLDKNFSCSIAKTCSTMLVIISQISFDCYKLKRVVEEVIYPIS